LTFLQNLIQRTKNLSEPRDVADPGDTGWKLLQLPVMPKMAKLLEVGVLRIPLPQGMLVGLTLKESRLRFPGHADRAEQARPLGDACLLPNAIRPVLKRLENSRWEDAVELRGTSP
jgi:hypothetical protein